MSDSMDSVSDIGVEKRPQTYSLRQGGKRFLAGNPFYLASAGLLLYGINQLTTDPKLAGAELPMLRLNFCALFIYELMLVCTAISLMRRKIWYDGLLLFGLTNLFIIVPFSLISRAVFLESHLALIMSLSGVVLAAGKFWAFKRYVPELSLPPRLLVFGSVILSVNAYAPLLFKNLVNNPEKTNLWLYVLWLLVLPVLAGLGVFLPRQADHGVGGKRPLPTILFYGWVLVTAFHLGGIGYANTFEWTISLLAPVAWVLAWTMQLRRGDWVSQTNRMQVQAFGLMPLGTPLLAVGSERVWLVLAGLNCVIYGLLFIFRERNFPGLARWLGAGAIVCAGVPISWVTHFIPGVTPAEWMLLTAFICLFGLVFRSRDPRLGALAALGLLVFCGFFAPIFFRYAVQVALFSLLLHSLRWDDQVHVGAASLRVLTGFLWVWISSHWLMESEASLRALVYVAAAVLLAGYLIRVVIVRNWKHWSVLVYALSVLLMKSLVVMARWLSNESTGLMAILASFILFALGSVAAFSKPKWWSPDAKR